MRNLARRSLLILFVSALHPTIIIAQRQWGRWPPRPQIDAGSLHVLLLEWQLAVSEHNPGEEDKSVGRIAAWPIEVAADVTLRVKELAEMVVRSRARGREQGAQDLLGLTDEEIKSGNANRILLRGSLLHTDIALLTQSSQALPGGPSELIIQDGRLIGRTAGPHWEIARRLLDSLMPAPAGDKMAHQWYLAGAAVLENRREWGNAEEHLIRARKIFPSDPRVLFYSGTLDEFYAGSFAQNSAIAAPNGTKYEFGSRIAELTKAQAFFRSAVTADPEFAEARLRLGRVTGLLGDHSRALDELKEAATAVTDDGLRYYARLFLGNEHEALGNYGEAKEQFGAAVDLFPRAQSPQIALCRLLRWSEGFPSAYGKARRVLLLPGAGIERADPWWIYEVYQARDADERLADIRRTIGGLPR